MHEVHCTVQESPLQVIPFGVVSGAFEGPSGAVGSLDLLPILQSAPVQGSKLHTCDFSDPPPAHPLAQSSLATPSFRPAARAR